MKHSIWQSLIRTSAFLLKELLEVARQPMLLVTLVVGPFLILFFFGIGFRNEPQSLRTLFVLESENSPLVETVERYATSLGQQLIFSGITSNREEATAKLNRGEVDLVVIVPSDPYDIIRNNNQAVFDLYHREINPIQENYINVFGRVYVEEVNRRVLRYITNAGQIDADTIETQLDVVDDSIDTLKNVLERCAEATSELGDNNGCNSEELNRYAQQIDEQLDEMEMELGDSADLSDSAQRWLRGDTGGNVHKDLQPTLNRVVRNANKLQFDELSQDAVTYLEQIQTLTRIETDLETVQERLAEFAGIDPRILVSPFSSRVTTQASVQASVTSYYAPAVIVMLLQHLTVTFAALSLVRERLLGSVELFSVSPISSMETLLGKYLSYLLFGSLLALVLFALLVLGMGVPLLGSWLDVTLITLTLIFTSLGIGFVISMISTTDTQAVQYSMIVLLTSVFFSGFILELHTLWQPVRLISWTLPVTYGIVELRNVMLRGNPLNLLQVGQLLAIGTGLFVLAWWLLRRSMKQL